MAKKGTSSKRKKHCETEQYDRISRLPDAVLCHILSFLSTKYAVGTSVLSKRWRYMWTSVFNLAFDDNLVFDRKINPNIFMNFVDRVLILRDAQSIKKFSLKIDGLYDSSRVNAWICAAVMRNVEELELYISSKESAVQLPQNLFSCEKLVVLKLDENIVLNTPESVSFPNLKVLHLISLQCLDETSLGKILSGSPTLEELYIHRDCVDDARTLHVHSLSLKSLKIDTSMYDVDDDDDDEDYKVVIHAPKLEFLELSDWDSREELIITGSFSLVKAIIDVRCYDASSSTYGRMVVELLRQISNVRFLCLSEATIKTLYKAMENQSLDFHDLPIFHNVTSLELRSFKKFIPSLLGCTPNLEVLVLYSWKVVPELLQYVPECLRLSLKVVQFNNFCEGQLEAVKYFLKKASVLEKMVIKYFASGTIESNVLKKLIMSPRASSSCQIAFY